MKNYFGFNVLALFLGVVSALYVSTPVGFVAMLDMLSYIVGPIMFIANYSRYTKHFRRLLLFLFLWILNAIVSDIWRGTPSSVAFKAEMILVNSFTLAVLGEWLMRKTPYALPLFLSGNAISAVISLYYFQNGALLWFATAAGYYGQEGSIAGYLFDKQVYPIYASCILMTIIMWLRYACLIPWMACVILTMLTGLYLLVNAGARSIFLIFTGTSLLMFLYVFAPRLMRSIFSHKVRTVLLLVAAAIIANYIYMAASKNGLLGEGGYQKYEEKVAGNITFMDDRADLLINWPFLWRSPVIGAGSDFKDSWGYVNESPYAPHYTITGHYINHQKFYGHSCIVGAWTANGLFGLLFWLYVLWLMADFMGEKVRILGDLGPFVIFVLVGMFWDILFSPYGGFRGKAMFCAAFIAMAHDKRFMNWVANSAERRMPTVGRVF